MKTWTGRYADEVKTTRLVLAKADALLNTVRALCPTPPVSDLAPDTDAEETFPSVPSSEDA